MHSRLRKVTSILLSASILFSYGVDLYADDEASGQEETVITESLEVEDESDYKEK